jgi:NADH-quinone oxidoreductase subunit L
MVTAGVFMVARLSPLFELAPFALGFVTFIGATTALFAATVGLVQNDIKRIVAYSTCSQLGYMFVAMGVGAYSVGMFHLFTHAFFKALLFLSAGSVITALHHQQDIRHMGGLAKAMPITHAMMLIGTLSLTGFPLTAGFFSKDAIVEAAYAGHGIMAQYAFWLTVIAAALTSFYSWRLMFVVFHQPSRVDHHTLEHLHESPRVMTVPLGVLAFGAVVAGIATNYIFAGAGVADFFRGSIFSADNHHILEEMHHAPLLVQWAPTLMMVAGFAVAYWFYIHDPTLPREVARNHQLLYRFLLNKWYFDEIYDFLLVRPTKWLGRTLWKRGDGWLIDGFGPDGVAARVLDVTRGAIRLQTGYLYHYAFVMLIGIALIISWFLVWGR